MLAFICKNASKKLLCTSLSRQINKLHFSIYFYILVLTLNIHKYISKVTKHSQIMKCSISYLVN